MIAALFGVLSRRLGIRISRVEVDPGSDAVLTIQIQILWSKTP